MTITPKNYEVGHGRPPKQTRWKKGQSGNPKRIRKRTSKPVSEMIDEFFAGEIDIVENGLSRRVSNFEAILLQLWNKRWPEQACDERLVQVPGIRGQPWW